MKGSIQTGKIKIPFPLYKSEKYSLSIPFIYYCAGIFYRPSGYMGWRYRFREMESWAPYNVKTPVLVAKSHNSFHPCQERSELALCLSFSM
jgi:hypothetical protein